MRDLLIHAYDTVDLEEVWEAYQLLPQLREQLQAIADAEEQLNP